MKQNNPHQSTLLSTILHHSTYCSLTISRCLSALRAVLRVTWITSWGPNNLRNERMSLKFNKFLLLPTNWMKWMSEVQYWVYIRNSCGSSRYEDNEDPFKTSWLRMARVRPRSFKKYHRHLCFFFLSFCSTFYYGNFQTCKSREKTMKIPHVLFTQI